MNPRLWVLGPVGVLDGDIDYHHVGCEELAKSVRPLARKAVEWISHGSPVGVQLVPDAAIASCVAALPLGPALLHLSPKFIFIHYYYYFKGELVFDEVKE